MRARAGSRRDAVEVGPARASDIDPLLAIENSVFPTDRLDRRGFRHAVASPTIDMLVARSGGEALGYAMVHRRRGSDLARLASIAVSNGAAGQGLGALLLEAPDLDEAVRLARQLPEASAPTSGVEIRPIKAG